MLNLDDFKNDPVVEEALEFVSDTEMTAPLTEDDDSSCASDVPGLLPREIDSESEDEHEDSNVPHWRTGDLHSGRIARKKSSVPIDLPDFDTVVPTKNVPPPPSVLHALHRSRREIQERQISVVDFYKSLEVNSVLLSRKLPPRGHIDGGALATTCNQLEYLWSYHPFSEDERRKAPRLKVADDTVHIPLGYGYIKIPCDTAPGYLFILAYYTPAIPAVIVSPDDMCRALNCRAYQTYSDIVDNRASMQLTDCESCQGSLDFSLHLIRGLLFSESLIAPVPDERIDRGPPAHPKCDLSNWTATSTSSNIRALTTDQQRALWHMRLGHVNHRAVSEVHEYALGAPNLPRADLLHDCPLCKRSKLHKAARGETEEIPSEACWQNINIDFGFIVQKSKASDSPGKARKSPAAKPRVRGQRGRKMRMVSTDRRSMPMRPLRRSSRKKRFEGSYSENARPAVETVSEDSDDDDDSIADTVPGRPAPRRRRPPASTATLPVPPDEQKYTFEKILTHEGPIDSTHKRWKGCAFNLKLKWSTGETSWEPLDRVFDDVPAHVVEYARQKNMLGNKHWKPVQDRALDPPADEVPSMADFDEEFESPEFDAVNTPQVANNEPGLSARYKRLVGLNGETCYCLITDRKSGSWKVAVCRDKSPPIDFFRSFLAHYKPDVQNCTVRFDGGGELGGSTEVHDIFERAGYTVEVTPPDTSSANGQAERPHRTIADGIRTMLHACGQPLHFWPYALKHFVLIHNMLRHGGRDKSCIEICTGRKPNLRLLRIFGCRIYALPPKAKDSKLDVNARVGIFLGYRKSLRSAYYYDLETKTVNTSRHVAFDEAMLSSDSPPPFAHYLRGAELPPDQLDLGDYENIASVPTPFTKVEEIACRFTPNTEHPLGFQVGRDPRFLRAFATSFNRAFGSHSAAAANRKYLGSYILKIGDYPVFSPDDIAEVIERYRKQDTPPSSLVVRLATDRRDTLSDSRPPALNLRPVDIRRIAAIGLVAGEGDDTDPATRRARVREIASQALPDYTPADADDLEHLDAEQIMEMRKLANDHMTPEERALPSFTRKNLQTLPNWAEWQAADDAQLENHFKAGTIGKAVPRPPKDPMKPSQVYRLHWARQVKSSGVRKSRACLDGSKRAAPWLRMMVQTYSSCVELPCLRAFVALAVNRGYFIAFGDVENAYQQSPPPTIDCFLEVDDTVYDWYLRKFGVKLNKFKDVIPLFKALQGHPEAGVLWERMITDILINKMGFKNTAHERNLYVGTIDGEEVLVCRQVDDFASAAASMATAEKFITVLRKYVEAEYAGLGIQTEGGMYQRYNGIDIFQTRDFVKISCESYLDRMFLSHGWENSRHHEKVPEHAVPLNPTTAARLLTLEGPPENSVEAREIAKLQGFKYRNVLGELIYAYVICRLDIGYSICLLARFADAPHVEHYKALKSVCRYLRAAKAWGIVYHRPKPLMELPPAPLQLLDEDPNLPPFPTLERDHLAGFLDAAHATHLKTRRSVTGLVIFFCCAAIAWKSRVQPIVATSSTEAEFYAAVTCAKIVKYLRYVLQELEALAPGPTELFIDNRAALDMINESRPTPRARHIEIQHFAIQEWRRQGDIIMRHIPGIVNPSDDMTKVLGWILHARHSRRSMGHYRLAPSNFGLNSGSFQRGINQAGEGVGAQFGNGSGSSVDA